jgi:ABC-type multidrug transport system ATPase subunit
VSSAELAVAIADLVDALRLGELVDRPIGRYSGGERRRLKIARALVSRARVSRES